MRFRLLLVLLFLLLSAFNSNSQTIAPLSNGFDNTVRKLCYDSINNYLYASGPFAYDGSGSIQLNQIARWNGFQWDSLGSGVFSGPVIWDMEMYQGNLIIGGGFTEVGGVPSLGLAKWDGNTWSSFASVLNTNGNPAVNCIYINGTDLYIGGGFTTVNGIQVYGIARYDGTSWHSYPQINFISISDIIIYNNELYIGGQFNNGTGQRDILKFDGNTWQPVGGGFPGQGWINEFCIYQGELVVGGYFQTAWGDPGNIVMWDGNNWSQLQSGLMPSNVQEMAVYDGNLYVVGQITSAGSLPLTGVGIWDGTNWSAFPYPFIFAELPNTVLSINNDLYMGGKISVVNGITVNNIFEYNISTGIEEMIREETSVLFPNPSSIKVTFQLPASHLNKLPLTLMFFNSMGQQVMEQEINDSPFTFSVEGFSSGIYGYQVRDRESTISTGKLVVE